ncbi:Hypothetical predicted protein [Cloeon dipterum]|uniref:Chitin-binding type-2 domain-containing protein n=1 Tax=Cloeon dipterum TaxID=197152 RepID=A0A8S1D7N4_9INSE|nr:Hypothetical predicted protein [Cloeon dipterum]
MANLKFTTGVLLLCIVAFSSAERTTTSCTTEGVFPLPGCVGFYKCYKTEFGFESSNFFCANGFLYHELSQTCEPASKVTRCSIPASTEEQTKSPTWLG